MNESSPQYKTNMQMYEFYVACHPRVYVNFVSRASEKSYACYAPINYTTYK